MVIDEETSYFTDGIYREIVQDEKLVFNWGATDGWPRLDPGRLDESPLVTVTLTTGHSGTEPTVHVQLPAELPDDGVPEWWPMVRNGWRDTVDRLAASLGRISTARLTRSSTRARLGSTRVVVRRGFVPPRARGRKPARA